MDPEVVEGIGNDLKRQGDAINQTISAINSLISRAEGAWHGHDAQEFKGWWESQHRPALHRAMEAVSGLGQSALNNASEQRQVSGR
jgi:uncharacterized protein YukE